MSTCGHTRVNLGVRQEHITRAVSISMHLTLTADHFDLTHVANAIRASSNFRFAWQFYHSDAPNLNSPDTVRAALDTIVEDERLHSFLRLSLDNVYPREFEIGRLHEHATIEQDNAYFLDTLARAALDRLGAYSREHTPASESEREPINHLFSGIGTYCAFTTRQGAEPGCVACKHLNNDLFCNWFYDVAWDYTFILTWPSVSTLWLGCLTDTD